RPSPGVAAEAACRKSMTAAAAAHSAMDFIVPAPGPTIARCRRARNPNRTPLPLRHLAKAARRPHHQGVFNETKGGDPMSSGFGFRSGALADRPFGKQSS
ncbi:MAG: hypothetical protein J0H53_07955, partial [Rhizobiales bacterium]|nr:hypothetical protein [Hyphomicrobiales bacterium]